MFVFVFSLNCVSHTSTYARKGGFSRDGLGVLYYLNKNRKKSVSQTNIIITSINVFAAIKKNKNKKKINFYFFYLVKKLLFQKSFHKSCIQPSGLAVQNYFNIGKSVTRNPKVAKSL
uniref:(northern house mosquito) hypothetical protein n=1 Tax=Culex pipiens TaxID=7175 RepID=A0A8D8BTJ2_CULPI